jgi:hypothetical protein
MVIVIVVVAVGSALLFARSQAAARQRQVDNATTVARHWTERLGGR